MPRQPRLDLANIPQHVIQRGNDRQPCFFTDVDRVHYLQDLREIALREHCDVHAYVLMTNHVHLFLFSALIHPHPAYLALGSKDDERHHEYRALAMETLSPDHLQAIRDHLQRQHALGSDRFRIAIEKQLSHRVGPAKIARPRKATQEQSSESAL